jgi:hypothetical protein
LRGGPRGGSVPLHPLGDLEDEPAETGEAQAPKQHDRKHCFDPTFHTMITILTCICKSQIVKGKCALEGRSHL